MYLHFHKVYFNQAAIDYFDFLCFLVKTVKPYNSFYYKPFVKEFTKYKKSK